VRVEVTGDGGDGGDRDGVSGVEEWKEEGRKAREEQASGIYRASAALRFVVSVDPLVDPPKARASRDGRDWLEGTKEPVCIEYFQSATPLARAAHSL
jgi:hypothetical protein